MKKELLILYACLFFVMVGFGIILPVLPFYIERMALAENVSSSKISLHVGVLTGIYALMQFFFAPLWGKISDRSRRRRPVFLFGAAGYALSMTLFGVGTNLTMLYTSRVLAGIFSAAILPIASAYVADVTSDEKRAHGMAWLGTVTGLGVVAGPAMGAFLYRIDWHLTFRFGHFYIDRFSTPFFAAAVLSFLTLLTAMKWLPESFLQPKIKDVRQYNSRISAKTRSRFLRSSLSVYLALSFLGQFALALFEGTFALHAQQVLNFGPAEMGSVFMVCGLGMAVVQGTSVGWLIERFGGKALLPFGFALMGSILVILMIAQKLAFILIAVMFFAFGMALLIPCIAVLITEYAEEDFGAALGIQGAANSLGQALGPVVGGGLFIWNIHSPYLLTAAILLTVAVLMARSGWFSSRNRSRDEIENHL